ncbi:MAG: hypothetical protein K0R98_1527 [Rickettsiaceae bacterium]|jgi:periplasmic divalent cation tolerance protein|nr:hypothetical protein [Rickettsiaceae bacterium]
MRVIYITHGSKIEALQLSTALVNENLVACANIIENMTSIYKWDGQIKQEAEAIIIAKTSDNLVASVIKRAKELHSYDCPAILSIKVDDGNKDFLKWVETSVKLPY